MAIMKKHSLIQIDFQSTVKLTVSEQKKIQDWLLLASSVIGPLILKGDFIHPSWIRNIKVVRVSVLLCGQDKMKKLNREYRGKDKVTDVLSFPTFETLRKPARKGEIFAGEVFLGDLAICHQRTKQQAREFSITYWDEFIHLFFHGLIHLLGYDHELSSKEEKIMQDWERVTLDLFSKAKSKTKKKGP